MGVAPIRPGTSGLAIASMVLGILWICGLGSLIALVLGIVALSQLRKSGNGGKGFAIAGIVLGSLGILVTVGAVVAVVLARDNVTFNEPDEKNDVSITGCGVKETESTPSADLSITNDSSRRSNYIVTINVVGSGSSETNIGIATLGPVDPGETKTFTVNAAGNASSIDGPFECSVTVNRLAAG